MTERIAAIVVAGAAIWRGRRLGTSLIVVLHHLLSESKTC
jgi:hypothetical protein